MKPPEEPVVGNIAGATEKPPAVSVCLQVLQKRSDFLRAAKAKHRAKKGFVLQARHRAATEDIDGIRIGYTCSKKVGNAVARNRAKRRLRAIARATLPEYGRDGWDYVLIGRAAATANAPYRDLCRDLRNAISEIHQ